MSNRSVGTAFDRVAGHDDSRAGPYGVEMPVPWNVELDATSSTKYGEEEFQKSKSSSDKNDKSNGETR
jgi:hypothetical protein